MTRRKREVKAGSAAAVALVAATFLGGCGDDVYGDECTAGVSCNEVYDVPADYELGEAASQASAGDCIALAPGSYGEVTLNGGVSLLGPSAPEVTVGTVTVLAGADPVVRHLTVAGVVKLRPQVSDARLDSLHVTGSKNGVQAEEGASFTLVDSTLAGIPENAILTVDAARISVARTTIRDGGGPGIWVQCGQGCDCTSPTQVDLNDVSIDSATYVGVSLLGATATLEAVDIVGTHDEGYTGNGGGLSVSGCSTITSGEGLTIEDSSGFGMLVDGATVDMAATPMPPAPSSSTTSAAALGCRTSPPVRAHGSKGRTSRTTGAWESTSAKGPKASSSSTTGWRARPRTTCPPMPGFRRAPPTGR